MTASTIKLGFFSPKTGPAASNFAGGEQAARLRVAQENAKGGINGRKIELIGYDDQANAATQITVANKALDSDHIFGLVMTSANDAAFPTSKSQNVPSLASMCRRVDRSQYLLGHRSPVARHHQHGRA